ncbi:DUF3916 domain-containing protein [Planomicrobium soli]|nr:DUF3916 domain-containing protein [Planomicrobium soli]
MREKKVRGKHRKMKSLIQRIEEYTEAFPEEFHNGYWYLPLPAAEDFINSSKTPAKVKRLCIQTLLDRGRRLSSMKPGKEKFCVVISVCLPDLWRSQLIIFEEDFCFEGFFNRNNEDQKWLPLPLERNLQTEWSLAAPNHFRSFGFQEVITDKEAGYFYDGELWFIGEFQKENF